MALLLQGCVGLVGNAVMGDAISAVGWLAAVDWLSAIKPVHRPVAFASGKLGQSNRLGVGEGKEVGIAVGE
jgi:hypothetical protein